ncbi:inovirus Gp2 family protein [Salmonella enterica subsp. diarizonae]|nr:inovirus Gp2 family protein [Salmonella enterica subsp. diarizonae]
MGSYSNEACLSALGLYVFPEYRTLVSLNNTPHFLEKLREDRFEKQRKSLLNHLSYFAKERTKVYSREARSFGASVR